MKIANDVLEVLRSLEWRGRVALVTKPFDAPLFERVYSALEDLGGTWSGMHQGHQFDTEEDRETAVQAINAGRYAQEALV